MIQGPFIIKNQNWHVSTFFFALYRNGLLFHDQYLEELLLQFETTSSQRSSRSRWFCSHVSGTYSTWISFLYMYTNSPFVSTEMDSSSCFLSVCAGAKSDTVIHGWQLNTVDEVASAARCFVTRVRTCGVSVGPIGITSLQSQTQQR